MTGFNNKGLFQKWSPSERAVWKHLSKDLTPHAASVKVLLPPPPSIWKVTRLSCSSNMKPASLQRATPVNSSDFTCAACVHLSLLTPRKIGCSSQMVKRNVLDSLLHILNSRWLDFKRTSHQTFNFTPWSVNHSL